MDKNTEKKMMDALHALKRRRPAMMSNGRFQFQDEQGRMDNWNYAVNVDKLPWTVKVPLDAALANHRHACPDAEPMRVAAIKVFGFHKDVPFCNEHGSREGHDSCQWF